MTARSKKLTQKTIAIIVIVAILDVIGLSPALIIFFFVAGFLLWRVVRRSDAQETRGVFDFYLLADEILRDEERHWYGFEISEVIHAGEDVLEAMPDPPPLVHFALGALHHRTGNYELAIELLATVVEDGSTIEQHRLVASPQLRRYVQMLRKIEREPAIAPQALAAVRSLERARQARAAALLAESRALVGNASSTGHETSRPVPVDCSLRSDSDVVKPRDSKLASITPPPPISQVLHDVYEEEKKTA